MRERVVRRSVCLAALVAAGVLAMSGTSAASTLRQKNSLPGATSRTAAPLAFGAWQVFGFAGPGSFNLEGAFTFYSRTPVLLRVTDGLCRGDRFLVYDHGLPVFRTSQVGTDTSCDDTPYLDMPGAAWKDQSYSKGSFLLEPGSHRVTIQATSSPFGGGDAWLVAIRQPVR
jgi:hypothetical protein